ncbi:MAG: glycosyltransferase [Leeuwenhoekiella sp.]
MKILLIHTYYTIRGGEDAVFEQETQKLSIDNEVRTITFFNKNSLAGALQFLFSIWHSSASKKVTNELREFKPDVVHIHNLHFAIGPLVIRKIKKLGVPLVLTLHNYRLICPSATLLVKGEINTSSVKAEFPWNAVFNKAYRESYILTFWLAFTNWFHTKIGTWQKVDKYIVLTDFARQLYLSSSLNLAKTKLVVKPNFVVQNQYLENINKGDHFLFVGRLSDEKGIFVLLEAFKNSSYKLRIAGDGPLKETVHKIATGMSNIVYLGRLEKQSVVEELTQCSALIFPSIWYEGMPMTIIEALSLGTPVIASNLGAMASMINHGKNGLLFKYGNSKALLQQVDFWTSLNSKEKEDFYNDALASYSKHYTVEKNLKMLNTIYQNAIKAKKLKK